MMVDETRLRNIGTETALKNIVKLLVGGVEHQGWSRVDIHRSIYTASGTFDLTLSPVWEQMPPEFSLYPGEICTLKIGLETVITGFIDSIRQRLDRAERMIEVSGRDKTADIVDCSSLRQSRVWNPASLETIANELLKPFHVPFIHPKNTGPVFPAWSIQEESVFDNLSRAASLRGFLLISDGRGNLVATRPSNTEGSLAFINEKSGVLNCEYNQDYRNRFSQYVTRGPNYGPTEGKEENLRFKIPPEIDSAIKRYRPILISQDGETREQIAKARLKWEARVRRAKSDRVEITLTSWKDHLGKLWDINKLVSLFLPSIGVSGKYLITSVHFTLDSSGTKTHLECESGHSADIDPTLEAKEINFRKALDQAPQTGGTPQ